MPSVSDILHKHGISVRRQSGTVRTTCPECSPHRRKSKEPVLSVTFDGKGVLWCCHHCSWSGAELCEPDAAPKARQRGERPDRSARPDRGSLSERARVRRPMEARR